MTLGEFLTVDFRDMTNYVALAVAVPLLWWGIATIIGSLR